MSKRTDPTDAVVIERTFHAPIELVWQMWTDPEHFAGWYGPKGFSVPVANMDVRVGGKYKWQWKNQEDGKQFGFYGTFTDVNAPSHIAHEEYYDPGDMDFSMPVGDPCIVSLDLSEHNGVTTLVCNMTFASKEARDGAVATGMTDGMEYSYARLEDVIKQAA